VSAETVAILWAGLAAIGLMGSALWSGTETGFYCLSRVRLDIRLSRPGDAAARRVRRELSNTGRLLATILLGNNICNYIGTLGVTGLLELGGLSAGLIVVLQVVVLTPTLLVFGESLPKEIFRLNADRLPYRIVPIVTASRWLMTATLVLPVLMLIVRAATRRLGSESSPLALGAKNRLLQLLLESAHSGAISGVQGALAERALSFERATVGEVMIPWSSVDRIKTEWSRGRALDIAARSGKSHLPVTDRRGRVVGVVHYVSLFGGEADPVSLCEEPARLSPREPVRQAVGKLAESRPGVAIVESGGRPVGLVAEHDLVSPLLGAGGSSL
jgi:CBS domain containing-hemolysin-like protein